MSSYLPSDVVPLYRSHNFIAKGNCGLRVELQDIKTGHSSNIIPESVLTDELTSTAQDMICSPNVTEVYSRSDLKTITDFVEPIAKDIKLLTASLQNVLSSTSETPGSCS
ncbi:unnamed protein product [Arctia plantaginis]|uniref:Uncharacterized protein n=1 Tax=Arctia plantaginis TaxID=874455 RepID=A0A8S1B2F3_ARCPL|nr:unnamed protein product [Arctia plantaginis]CAB3253113.1 unnamed protein product [Arctia plantaginis]